MRECRIKSLLTGFFHMNWGLIMRTLAKLDMMADIIIPGRDPELIRMKDIPDECNLEEI